MNWWAIGISMIASVVIGFVWYGPLFGKMWMKELGMTMPEEAPNMTKPIALSLLGAFFMAFTLCHSITFGNAYLGTSGISSGVTAAFWHWLGFVAPVMLSFVAWEGKSWKLFCIQAGYWLTLLLVMGAVIAGLK